MCAIIRNPTTSMPSLRAWPMCCRAMSASVEWVAMRTDCAPASMRGLEIFDGPDAGQQQDGHPGALDASDHCRDPLDVAVRAEPIREARAGQSIAVRDFDRIHARAIERSRDSRDVGKRILMTDGVHAIAQRDVLNVERAVLHAIAPPLTTDPAVASRSPVRSAADVMMSRLPAYFGR